MSLKPKIGSGKRLRRANRAVREGRDLEALCHYESALQETPNLSSFILPDMEKLCRRIVADSKAQPSLLDIDHKASLNILFVLHSVIDSNSGYHIQLHARRLSALGMDCLCLVAMETHGGSEEALSDLLKESEATQIDGLRCLSHERGMDTDFADVFQNGHGPDLVYAWTPRENVRRVVEAVRYKNPCPLVIHLEDNEEYLTETTLGAPFGKLRERGIEELDQITPNHVYHPIRGPEFLEEASGLTSCIDTLDSMNPGMLPNLVIGSPVDRSLFYPRPRNEGFRERLGIAADEVVLAYTGNTHQANVSEVSELYQAVGLLNDAGIPTHLLRTGEDIVTCEHIRKAGSRVHHLGWMARDEIPEVLAAADILVQPGSSGEMNDKRFPSKLPEYFAMGLPVILPAANIGSTKFQTETQWIVDDADAGSIAQAVRDIRAARPASVPPRIGTDPARNTLAVYLAGVTQKKRREPNEFSLSGRSAYSRISGIMSPRLLSFKKRHTGERCVLVANGPSLNEMDLSFLADEITIGMNKIFLGFELFGFHPKYYLAVNEKVVAQAAAEIQAMTSMKFISRAAAKDHVFEDAFTHYITTHPYCLDAAGEAKPFFSRDIARDGVNEGWTVTHVALQFAYYLGFTEVVIIGLDHRFSFEGGPNEAQVLEGADPNHFCSNYFGGGHSWDTPDLAKSEAAYKIARDTYEAAGRRILDATVDGACTVFEKVDYRMIFAKNILRK